MILAIDFQWKKKDFKETDPPNLMISTDIRQSFVPLNRRLYETFPQRSRIILHKFMLCCPT